MKVSEAGIELIKRFEGRRLAAYQDVGGVWTVGVGHTKIAGALASVGLELTESQVDHLLALDLSRFEAGVNVLTKGLVVTQGQFDALVSFAFNLGIAALSGSTLMRLLDAGATKAAADEFAKWCKVGGKEVAGLTARREAERTLFLGVA